MFQEERRTIILEKLNKKGRCQVSDLSQELNVSEVTIRQDLSLLEKQGLLRRTHGGAILTPKTSYEQPFQVQETENKTEKIKIAQAASEHISDGDTIIMDVGTTVTELTHHLGHLKSLTVITNALNIALLLEQYPNITVMVTGGTLRAKQHSLVNPYAQIVLEKLHVDTAFLGINGISADKGVTNVNLAEAEIKSMFVKSARKKVVMADSTKVGNIALAKIAEISDIDLLITDNQADTEELKLLEKMGLPIQVV